MYNGLFGHFMEATQSQSSFLIIYSTYSSFYQFFWSRLRCCRVHASLPSVIAARKGTGALQLCTRVEHASGRIIRLIHVSTPLKLKLSLSVTA